MPDATAFLPPGVEVSQQSLALAALVVVGLILSRRGGGPQARRTRTLDKGGQIRRARNTGLLRRLWWRIRPPRDVMRVDGLVIDRTGKRSHALWPGPTGAGKSESVATVRCDGARPWLAVMPDVSDPLRRRADFVWTAGESLEPIDFLKGTPEDVGMRLTSVFRSGGNGVWMMAAREAVTQVVRASDAAGHQRSLEAIGVDVEELVESNRRLRTACEGWVTRFRSTAMAMGPSVAAGGVDIGDLLRAGKGVVIDNDRWKHPGLCGDTVAFGLAEAKRVADLVPGGFRLIFEEADQLGERIDLADPFFAAGRRRLIAVDALVHAEEDADDAMATNSATRVYFRPNKPEQRAKVAKALDLSEADVDGIPDYHAWIEHDGKVRRLVHFPKPPEPGPSAADGISERERMGKTDGELRMVPRMRVEEQRQWTEVEPQVWEDLGPKMLPPPSAILDKLLANIYPERGCDRWGGKHDKDGYGLVWLDGRWQKVHRVRYEMAYGAIPRNPDGTTQTVDHLRGVCLFKDCSKLVHLRLLSRSNNSKDRWSTRGRERKTS